MKVGHFTGRTARKSRTRNGKTHQEMTLALSWSKAVEIGEEFCARLLRKNTFVNKVRDVVVIFTSLFYKSNNTRKSKL